MLFYDRIDISKGIDLAKSNNSKECMICNCWFFNHVIKPGIKSTVVKSSKILNDSVFNIGKNYYPLEFLEECK